jgi:hypothetical protein
VIVVQLVDAVDQQERIAMRQDPLDVANVEHQGGRRYFFGGAAGTLAVGPPGLSAPSPLL